MRETVTSVCLKCDDHEEMLEFSRIEWSRDDVDYEVSIKDSYCGGDYRGIIDHFRRAWRAFWGKPIYYTSIYVDDPARVKEFLERCVAMMCATEDVPNDR